MKRAIFSAIFLAMATVSSAYEKIEFKGLIQSPSFQKPSAVAVAGGRVYVADSVLNAVLVFDAEGKQLRKIEGALKGPEALAFGGGKLYVADTGNSRVAAFDEDGRLLWVFGSDGSAPGQLKSPRGIAFGPDGRLYVSNTGNSRVDVFNSDGIYLYGFPVGKADGITKLRPAKISLNRSGDIVVSDPDRGVLQRYDRAGKLLREYNMPNEGAAFDKYGFLYAINSRDGKVMELSEAGEKIGTFGTKGKGRSEFRNLRDIALDKDGTLYLCDADNKKVALIRVVTAYSGPRLPEAVILDRFTVKGPAAKFPYKADVVAVTPEGAVAAWMPEARELSLFADGTRKTLVKEGRLQGQVRSPRGLLVSPKGKIYVADTGNDRVQIFNADGTFDNMFGESGSGEGQFKSPSAVAVNAAGNIFVADTRNRQLKAFSADGMFLFAAGPQLGNLVLANPVAVACDEKKNVYILDSALKKVIVTDSMGKFLRIWDDSGALQDPVSLVYDGKGFFYILDRGTYNVKIFDAAGKFTAGFFARGKGERELWAPAGLAFGGDRIYVSDPELSRVSAFDISYIPEPPYALAARAGDASVKLSWQAGANAWTSGFKVLRAAGSDEPAEAGAAREAAYEDTALVPGTTYYYYAAALSVSGTQGGLSSPVEVYFKGPEAPAPGPEAAAERKNVAPMEIVPSALNFIFSANYKYYMKKPVGRVTVQNNTQNDFSNVKLSFFFKDFMDFPSDTVVPEVKAGSKVDVDLVATLNNRILNITEDTPIQCQLTLTYYQDGSEKTFTLNQPVKVLSKNAIVWDNAARLANFITVKDPTITAFRTHALLEKKNAEAGADLLDENLLTGLLGWEALGELGVTYLADPVSPYAVLKSTKELVLDTVQFPRNTLKLKSGDCDDLTALFASVYEASGLRVALLDFPSHIALMFDTGATDASQVGVPGEYLIKYNNTWWVGVETTMVGKSFYDSLVHAADLYRKMEAEVRVIDVRAAWAEFEPVTLPETEADKYASPGLTARVKGAVAVLLDARYSHLKKFYGNILQDNPEDVEANISLGILHAEHKAWAEAGESFGKALEKEPFNAGALNNLGNLRYQDGKYEEAKEYYFKAAKADPYDGGVWLNMARASVKLGRKDDVKAYADRAAKIDPALKSVGDKLAK